MGNILLSKAFCEQVSQKLADLQEKDKKLKIVQSILKQLAITDENETNIANQMQIELDTSKNITSIKLHFAMNERTTFTLEFNFEKYSKNDFNEFNNELDDRCENDEKYFVYRLNSLLDKSIQSLLDTTFDQNSTEIVQFHYNANSKNVLVHYLLYCFENVSLFVQFYDYEYI